VVLAGSRFLSGAEQRYAPIEGEALAIAWDLEQTRTFFSTFGVPEELSSDGGPEFTASTTGEFLQRWGVRHRLSSAYHL